MNMMHREIRVKDDFGISKVVTSRLQTRNIENRQNIRRCGVASIIGRKRFAKKTTCRAIGHWLASCFQSAVRDEKDSVDR